MTTDKMTLIQQLRGRAQYLRDMKRVKSPQLMEQAADALEAHLAPREVSDELQEAFAECYTSDKGLAMLRDPECGISTVSRVKTDYSCIPLFIQPQQADRQRGGVVSVPNFSSVEFDLPEGYEVEEFIPGVWQYTFEENGQGMSSNKSWNNPLHAAIGAWQDYTEALLAQRGQVRERYAHQWDRDGERCVKCGDKDWMGGKCSVPDADAEGNGNGA